MIQSDFTPTDCVPEHAVTESGPGAAAAPTRSPRRSPGQAARGCRCKIGSLDVRTLPVGGQYWGVLICTRCGRPHQWLAKPRPLAEAVEPPPPPPPWLVALAERHQGPPAELRGTERQCLWAETIRTELKARHQDDPEVLRVLDVVTHPGWFIRNRGDGNIQDWPTRAEVAAGTDPAAQPADGDAAPGG